jgi:hypothetical protein
MAACRRGNIFQEVDFVHWGTEAGFCGPSLLTIVPHTSSAERLSRIEPGRMSQKQWDIIDFENTYKDRRDRRIVVDNIFRIPQAHLWDELNTARGHERHTQLSRTLESLVSSISKAEAFCAVLII